MNEVGEDRSETAADFQQRRRSELGDQLQHHAAAVPRLGHFER